jgi:hypothetical protein
MLSSDTDPDSVATQDLDPIYFLGVLVIENPYERLIDKQRDARKDLLTETAWTLIEQQWRRLATDSWKDGYLRKTKTLKIQIVGQVSNSVRYLQGRFQSSALGTSLNQSQRTTNMCPKV